MHELERILIGAGAAKAGLIPYSCCRVINSRLVSRLGFEPKSVCIGIIPYYTHHCDTPKTVSAYALAHDYHKYIAEIGNKAIEACREAFPANNFAFFGDHSPIAEKEAAAKAGLGIIGRHSLLITPEYSSYVFLAEIITDIECARLPAETQFCKDCGACISACPGFLSGICECLSAITQKKGELTDEEAEMLSAYNYAWGCDICQEVCPHTIAAKTSGSIYTDTEWFNGNIVANPDPETVNDEKDFINRAYSWRGKSVILRNIEILNKNRD